MPPRDDYQLRQTVGEINGKLDRLLENLDQHFEDDRLNFAALGTRITTLDEKVEKTSNKIAWFSGAWAIVVLGVGYIFKGH